MCLVKKLILIKLGGSVITDKSKPFVAKPDVIKRLVGEIIQAKKVYKGKILIGHGSGSFGHTVAAKYKTQEGMVGKDSLKGFSLTAEAAVKINRVVIRQCLNQALPVASFSPLSFIYAKEGKPLFVLTSQIKKALEIGLIPVIYGDVVMDETVGFCIYSGEKILDLLAIKLLKYYKIDKIIMVGGTDGVLDEEGKTIVNITSRNYSGIKKSLSGSKAVDVTGGMLHKVEESLNLAVREKISTVIINGNKRDNLMKEILGKDVVSTTIY